MEVALIVGFSILLAITLAASSLIYSYYIYSKNRLFSKTKYAILWIVLSGVVFVATLISGILFLLAGSEIIYSLACGAIAITISIMCLAYMVCLLLIPTLTNKNKIAYEDILKVDYDSRLKQLLSKIGDVEALKNKVAKSNKNHYTRMLFYYENILKRLKNEKISNVEKLADIVTFNDAFTHKWCTQMNNYQLLLTYQFCSTLVKIS